MKKIAAGLATISAFGVSLSAHAMEFKFKGFVKAEAISSDNSVGSFGTAYSQTAITRANRIDPSTAQLTKYGESSATSIQTAQTRFGFEVTEGKAKGILEFDLIDPGLGFTNQTALQASGPRTRLAYVTYDFSDETKLFVGQKWSTAAGIAWNGSYNFVGDGFQAGKVAFLNEELGVQQKVGAFLVTAALTGKGRNFAGGSSAVDGANQNELGVLPGLAASIEFKQDDLLVGVAGHGAQLNWENTAAFTTGKDRAAYLAKAYASKKFGDLKAEVEAYTGSNVNNLNGLGIAKTGTANLSFYESGAWANLTYDVTPSDVVRLGYGTAAARDRDSLAAGDLGKNMYAHLNYGHTLSTGLTAYGQYTRFDSAYGSDDTKAHANVLQAGLLYKF